MSEASSVIDALLLIGKALLAVYLIRWVYELRAIVAIQAEHIGKIYDHLQLHLEGHRDELEEKRDALETEVQRFREMVK